MKYNKYADIYYIRISIF